MTDLRDEAAGKGVKKSICEIKTLSNVLKDERADKKMSSEFRRQF